MMDTAEIFHLWVIQGDHEDELPLKKAGFHVVWTDNVDPYKKRKVRILNGAHTSFVLASYLCGNDIVKQSMEELEIYGTADPAEYPLQKKGHSLEFLREIAHLRPRTNTFGAVLRIRHALAFAIHKSQAPPPEPQRSDPFPDSRPEAPGHVCSNLW